MYSFSGWLSDCRMSYWNRQLCHYKDKMDLFTSQQMRELDTLVIERTPISAYELMCRAGRACSEVLVARWPQAKSVAVFCGAGNNGGDGYVIARLLLEKGFGVQVYALGGDARGGAAQAQQDYLANGGGILLPDQTAVAAAPVADVIVDALFGTGLSRPLGDEICRWIDFINAASVPVLAVDVPSGLDADTGAMCPQAVCADVTVTFIAHKRGMYTACGSDCCGEIVFDALGAAADILTQVKPVARLADLHSLPKRLPHRRKNVHKGSFGHVLVVGGGHGMAGAARLTGEAALRTGAGRVSIVAAPESIAAIVAGCPALMVYGVAAGNELDVLLKGVDVVAVGPGLGCNAWGQALMTKVLDSNPPKVVDADALNLLAADPAHSDQWILTPHPGEAGRLLGVRSTDIGSDRFAAAERIVSRFGGVCVLKGSGTLVHSDHGTLVCAGGNAGMATAGMGDVLSGVVAALVAQGLSLNAAAELGVCIHAEAGDRAAGMTPRGLIATDLMPHIRACVNWQGVKNLEQTFA